MKLILTQRLVDGTGQGTRANQAVLVNDGRIAAVGRTDEIQGQAPPEAEVVDLGSTCLD